MIITKIPNNIDNYISINNNGSEVMKITTTLS